MTYSGTQNDTPATIVVRVADNGEGANATGPDTISVTSSAGYTVAGNVGGNIQLAHAQGLQHDERPSRPKGGGKP